MPIYHRLSIEQAIAAARSFAAADRGLLVPVVLAFQLLPVLLFNTAVPADIVISAKALQSGQFPGWIFALLAVVLLVKLYGGLVLSVMSLVPRASVGEAVHRAFRALPVLLAAWLLIGLATLFGSTMIAAALVVVLGRAADPTVVAGLVIGVSLGLMIMIGARMLPLVPSVAERPLGPIAAVRASWRMTHGHSLRLLGFLLVFLIGSTIVDLALGSALGSVLLLVGRGLGIGALAAALAGLLEAIISAVISAALILIVAQIYRQLAPSSNGI